MELKDLLKEKRREKGLTLQEVADAVGVNVSTLSRYERGEIASMKTVTMKALSKLLDIPLSKFIALPDDEKLQESERMVAQVEKKYNDLLRIVLSMDLSNLGDEDFEAVSKKFDEIIAVNLESKDPAEAQRVRVTKRSILRRLNEIQQERSKNKAEPADTPKDFLTEKDGPKDSENAPTMYRYPLYGDIACGEPIYVDGQLHGYIETDVKVKADFCIRAKGDSMIGDRICDGDLVFIKSQPAVENGEIAAVLVDGEATLKRVYFDKELEVLRLFPSNPTCKIQTYSGPELETVHILGKAVKCQFDLNV